MGTGRFPIVAGMQKAAIPEESGTPKQYAQRAISFDASHIIWTSNDTHPYTYNEVKAYVRSVNGGGTVTACPENASPCTD